VGGVREGGLEGLPLHLADYLELVNWTGRAVRDDKRGAIAEDLPPRGPAALGGSGPHSTAMLHFNASKSPSTCLA